MSLHYPTSFAEHTTPLPFGLSTRADEAMCELASRNLSVHTGLTVDYAKAIGRIAQQPTVREYCINDSNKRFANPESTKAWLQKGDDTLQSYGRGVFLLLHENGEHTVNLAGYGWTGPETSPRIPDGKVTFAIRMNESFQGMKAARLFTDLILAGSAALYGAGGIWLEAWGSNTRATSTYERAGFVLHPNATEYAVRPSIRFGSEVPDIRLYMSLPDELIAS